jgi:hypothetical protein
MFLPYKAIGKIIVFYINFYIYSSDILYGSWPESDAFWGFVGQRDSEDLEALRRFAKAPKDLIHSDSVPQTLKSIFNIQ